jgi:hypothetical protein
MVTERDAGLTMFNVSKAAVLPLLSSLRLVNSVADNLFYDVGELYRHLGADGYAVVTARQRTALGTRDVSNPTRSEAIAKHVVNLGALANPEGVILVIDAECAPYVTPYADINAFLAHETRRVGSDKRRKVRTASITGVGSSALGTAAFAWNVSSALNEPVAAIVPGYGLADILPQALGGWFGFGVENFLRRFGQQWMEWMAPQLAHAGRRLLLSAPRSTRGLQADEPLGFRTGCPGSDILHATLLKAPDIVRLYGHSKGALCIENALRTLPAGRAERIAVTTFGCAIAEETNATYEQILGNIDGLGQLNSWGNAPEHWIESSHTTNTKLSLPMRVAQLTQEGQAPQAQARRHRRWKELVGFNYCRC